MKSLSTTEMLLCAAEAGARFHGYDDKGKPIFSYAGFCLNAYNKKIQRKLRQKENERSQSLSRIDDEFHWGNQH